jgi:hypothetical protein
VEDVVSVDVVVSVGVVVPAEDVVLGEDDCEVVGSVALASGAASASAPRAASNRPLAERMSRRGGRGERTVIVYRSIAVSCQAGS